MASQVSSPQCPFLPVTTREPLEEESSNLRTLKNEQRWAGPGEDPDSKRPPGLFFSITRHPPLLHSKHSHSTGANARKTWKLTPPPSKYWERRKCSSEMVRGAIPAQHAHGTGARLKGQGSICWHCNSHPQCRDKLWSHHLGWLLSVFHSLGSFNWLLSFTIFKMSTKKQESMSAPNRCQVGWARCQNLRFDSNSNCVLLDEGKSN